MDTSKDKLSIPPRLKLLEQMVHELVGEGGRGGEGGTEPPLDNVVGSKRLRSGRINIFLLTLSPKKSQSPRKEAILGSVLVFEQRTKQRQLNAQINNDSV